MDAHHASAGLGISNLDVPITRSVFDTLANHYPERMGVLFMFDAPFIFWYAFARALSLMPNARTWFLLMVMLCTD